MDNRNIFQFISEFVNIRIENIEKNIYVLKESMEPLDKKFVLITLLRIAFDVIILTALIGVVTFLSYQCIQFALMILNFLKLSENKPIRIVVQGILVMFVISLILNEFQKKPKLMATERQEDSLKKLLARDLLSVTQDLSRMYGISRADSISDLSSFALSPCEEICGVLVFKFSLEKDISSEKQFDPQRYKQSMIRRLKKKERDNELTTATPYGYLGNDEELCSILIFDVIDCGDYIEINCARADEESYALYKRLSSKDDNKTDVPVDPDF